VREADGMMHEFQASGDTLRDVAVGGRVNAKLRRGLSSVAGGAAGGVGAVSK
jgi:hypothetical protein